MTASAFTDPAASSRSFVEGFMVWPPETMTSTPRLFRISAWPEPAATATKPRGLRSACLLGGQLLGALGRLNLHVVDEHLGDLTVIEEILQHLIGVVGVHVHLELRHLAHAQLAVAHGGEELKRGILVQGIGIHEELVAVAVSEPSQSFTCSISTLGCDPGRRTSRRPWCRRMSRAVNASKMMASPKPPASTTPMLLEHGQKVGRALH